MQRYLGLTVDDMVENDTMWREEKLSLEESSDSQEAPNLRNVGITPGGIENDLEGLTPPEIEAPEGEEGAPPAGGVGGAAGTEAPGGAGTPTGAAPPIE